MAMKLLMMQTMTRKTIDDADVVDLNVDDGLNVWMNDFVVVVVVATDSASA